MEKFTAVSLFCGAGGLDIGFEKAGFKTIWANDFNKDACTTFEIWSKAKVVCDDISRIDSSSIPDSDIILGGFPCQGFSLSGPRKLDDKRNVLYREYVRIVEDKKPMVFVGENVKGLLTMGNGEIFEAIVSSFSKCGYKVFYKLMNAKFYNVPEDRERVIIVGIRKDLNVEEFNFPFPSEKITTLKQVLENVKFNEAEVCNAPFSSRYMSRNRKRAWDEVSFTIPAMAKQVPLWPGSPDMKKIGKDRWEFGNGETRRLSWKEAASIQTFPKDMTFEGDLTSIYRQIGNAVPCNLAKAIAKEIYKLIRSKKQEKKYIYEREIGKTSTAGQSS